MHQRKYQVLFSDSINYDGIQAFRIRALIDFADVKAGDLGGYVEHARILSHDGSCWIYPQSCVIGMSHITDHAVVYADSESQLCVVRDSVVGQWARVGNSLLVDCDMKGTSDVLSSALSCVKARSHTTFNRIERTGGTLYGGNFDGTQS